MDRETLSNMPKSFQTWQRIEQEAQKRAEVRLHEILTKNKNNSPVGIAPGEHPKAERLNIPEKQEVK